jgi:hypothetical protein
VKGHLERRMTENATQFTSLFIFRISFSCEKDGKQEVLLWWLVVVIVGRTTIRIKHLLPSLTSEYHQFFNRPQTFKDC